MTTAKAHIQVVHDYAATSLPLKAHPVSFIREKLDQLHILPKGQLPGPIFLILQEVLPNSTSFLLYSD